MKRKIEENKEGDKENINKTNKTHQINKETINQQNKTNPINASILIIWQQ